MAIAAPLTARADGEWARAAPFTGIRFTRANRIEVELDRRWWVLQEIEGRRADWLAVVSRARYGEAWQHMLATELVTVLMSWGWVPRPRVELVVCPLDKAGNLAGPPRALSDVEMLHLHWQAIVAKRGGRTDRLNHRWTGEVYQRYARRERGPPSPAFRALAARRADDASPLVATTDAQYDLDVLEGILRTRHAYLSRAPIDVGEALDTISDGLGASIPRDTFALQLAKFLALLGDGHAGVVNLDRHLGTGGHAAFLVEDTAAGVVAFRPDRREFIDPGHPLLVSIDGLPLDRWLTAAQRIIPHGSPQMRRLLALGRLRDLEWLRAELDLPRGGPTALALASLDGTDVVRRELPTIRRRPTYGDWPRGATRALDPEIGYLRLASMGEGLAFQEHLARQIASVRNSRALVIDLRGNDGGLRDAIHLLVPFLAPAQLLPRVASVGAYRLATGPRADRAEGFLDLRGMWPITSWVWSDAERRYLGAFSTVFQPEWPLPPQQFSRWHYLLVREAKDARLAHYPGPVALLIDEHCASATEVLIGALAELPSVELIGLPTRGASGLALVYGLPATKLDIALSAMASYRATGELYEGKGIAPTTRAPRGPTDCLGTTDAQLEVAVTRLRARLSAGN